MGGSIARSRSPSRSTVPDSRGSRATRSRARCWPTVWSAGSEVRSSAAPGGSSRRASRSRTPSSRSRSRGSTRSSLRPPCLWSTVSSLGAAPGVGRLPADPNSVSTPRVAHRFAHVEVLVIGGGASGRAAARAASEDGDRVLLVDEHRTLDEPPTGPDLTVLPNATALGVYDDGYAVVLERSRGEDVVWHVRAGRVVLATGAFERPIAFAGNDLPGVMLAGAAAAYVERYGVRPGERAAVFATNEWGFAVADVLRDSGVDVVRTIDAGSDEVVVSSERRGPSRTRPRPDRRWRRGGRGRRPARGLGRLEPEPRALAFDRGRPPVRRRARELRPGRGSVVALGHRLGRGRRAARCARLVRRGRRRRREVRRPAARSDGRRHRRGAGRWPALGRAREASHLHRDRRRSGPHERGARCGDREPPARGVARRPGSEQRATPVRPGLVPRARRPDAGRPPRSDPDDSDASVARRARGRVRERRAVEAPVVLPARGRTDGARGRTRVPRGSERRRRDGRVDARQDRGGRAPTRRRSSTACTRTGCRTSRSARSGTA